MARTHRIAEQEISPNESEIVVEDKQHHVLLRISVKQIITLVLALSFVLTLCFLVFFADRKTFFEGYPLVASIVDFKILEFILVGLAAQMIDGALGMAYGVSSNSFLLSIGVPPQVASASIHIAELVTTFISGLSHLKFGNVNMKLTKALVIPGVVGAFLGAFLISKYGEEYGAILKPYVSAYLLIIGFIILRKAFVKNVKRKPIKQVSGLAFIGGFMDSAGGGGWGPIVTSNLLSKGKTPRYIIGSVNLAEFFIAIASALTFGIMVGIDSWKPIIGLIIGGAIAAPFAALFASKINAKTMMGIVGVLIIVLSLRTILKAWVGFSLF